MEALKKNGQKGAIFVGRQYLATPNRRDLLAELMKLQTPHLSLNLMEGRGNSLGARLAGMRPDLGPFGERLSRPGLNALQVLESAAKSNWDFLYVAGANPAMQFPSKLWFEARQKLGFLVVQDLFLTETAQQADLVLPSLTFIEKGGTFVNIEGRLQSLLPGKEIPENLYSDSDIFMRIGDLLNLSFTLDPDFVNKLAGALFSKNRPTQLQSTNSPAAKEKGPHQSLAATFVHSLFDHGVRMQHDVHLIHLAKEPYLRLHPQEAEKRGFKNDDSVRLSAGNQSITAKIKLDKRVALNTVVIPLGFEKEIPVHELGTNLLNGMLVELFGVR